MSSHDSEVVDLNISSSGQGCVLLDKYMFCHVISFMPYFYQTKFKRLNKYTKTWVEYNQKYLLIQRVLNYREKKRKHPDYYEYFSKEEWKRNNDRILLELDDFKHVEKNDFEKFDLYSIMEDPERLIKFLKQVYYLEDKRWLLYWNNVGDLYFTQKTTFDPDMLFGSKYEDKFELEGNKTLLDEHISSHFFICLSLVGVNQLIVPLPDYLGSLYTVGVTGVEFLFSNLEISSGGTSYFQSYCNNYTVPFFSNCFTSVRKSDSLYKLTQYVPVKTNIQSKKRAEKYLLQCAKAHNVHPSLVPKGELFAYSMFHKEQKSNLLWERALFFYENSIIPVCEKLKNVALGKQMDISQFLFEPIIEIARKTYLSEKSESKFLTSLNQFQQHSVVRENKERLEIILKFVNEESFASLALPLLVRSIDSETKTKFQKFYLHTTLQIKKFKLEDYKLFSWEHDFMNNALTFMPKTFEPKPVDISTQKPVKQKKKKNFPTINLD